MTRLAWSLVMVACGSEAPKSPEPSPPAPVDAAIVPIDAAIAKRPPPDMFDDLEDHEAKPTGPIPPRPVAVPMPPGIHPILVSTSALEDSSTFFVLACAKVETGKPTKFLDGKKCAPMLQNPQLEMILPTSRVQVKVIGKGTALDCPWVGAHRQPTVKLAGVPKGPDGTAEPGDVVSKGMVDYLGPVDADTLNAIRKVAPLSPTKRPGAYGPNPNGQYDLDGDGKLEVMMSFEGTELRLFDASGTEIASLGCYLG